MLWLIQETIVFVELASLCKNPIKPSLLYSKANQGNIFQSKTLMLYQDLPGRVSIQLEYSVSIGNSSSCFYYPWPQNIEPPVLSCYVLLYIEESWHYEVRGLFWAQALIKKQIFRKAGAEWSHPSPWQENTSRNQ